MPPRYSYRSATGSNYDRSSYFPLYTLDVITHAEEGSVGTSTATAQDPNGTLDIAGHQKITVTEDLATGSNTVIYVGFTGNRTTKRGEAGWVEAARNIEITLHDMNTLLSRRVFRSGEAERPEETDVARINWAMTKAASNEVQDESLIAQVNPVDMDEVDYRGQTLFNILDDCAQQSGKNWFVWYNETSNQFGLWYDFSASSNWTSPLRMSNYLSDIDSSWTFAISDDSTMTQDPSRVYSLAYVTYDGGAEYATNESTASNFARRDTVMPAVNVKTAKKAQARAQRYINDLATEETIVKASILVPAERVNYLKAGQRIRFRASHFEGLEDWTWLRCVSLQVKQITEQVDASYLLTAELVSPVPAPEVESVYGILYVGNGPRDTEYGDNLLYYANPGDTPGPGFAYRPTLGPLTMLQDTTPPGGNGSWYGIRVDGDGLIDVDYFTTTVGVMVGTYEITYAILKNGVAVASAVSNRSGDLVFMGDAKSVAVTGLVVEDGDIISGYVNCVPAMPFFRSPGGTGQNGERLEITGGSVTS